MKKILLLTLITLFPAIDGSVSTAFASQEITEKALPENVQKISGKVTEVIISAGFSYIQLNTGVEKIWVARPGSTSLKEGDMTAFTAEMRMQDFHSKSLGRDFSVIYFIKNFSTEKESPVTDKQDVQSKSTSTTSMITPDEVQVGESLREMVLNGLNGEDKAFSNFKGKPLIINVWASWCGPCRAEMGALKNLAQRYNGKQFNLIGISTDDYRDRAEAFIKQTDIQFENFLDHKLQLENMLGASRIPLTIFVDKDGKVLEKIRGSREWDKPVFIDAIGEVLGIELDH